MVTGSRFIPPTNCLPTTILLLIATGERYWQYIRPLLRSADEFFVPHETLLLTDCLENFEAFRVWKNNAGFPETTLKRYHSFLEHQKAISKFDYAFYIDIDAIFVKPVGGEIFSGGITATLHHNQNFHDLLEENPKSAAYTESVQNYFCGGFNGGTTTEYLKMAESIRSQVDADESKRLLARWHDESHLNKYLADNPPSKILTSDYCYPEPELFHPNQAKIVCLDKSLRGGR